MVLSMERWVGKVAVVTGATSDIGVAVVEALAAKGVKVVALARKKECLQELVMTMYKKVGKIYGIRTDVTDEKDILNAFTWIRENLGPVHVLINNSGVGGYTTLADGDIDIWRSVININVISLCIATREAIKDMRANKVDGHIIHINSILGHKVIKYPNLNVYPASKFAITALAETLRLELMNMKSKIKITSLSPGPVYKPNLERKLNDKGRDIRITLNGNMSHNHRGSQQITSHGNMNRVYMALKQLTLNGNTNHNHKEEKSNGFNGDTSHKYNKGKQIIKAEDVADAVLYVLSTPPHVQIQELTIRSVGESTSRT